MTFANDIVAFNNMYRLPVASAPTIHVKPVDRLRHFKDILSQELDEIDGIIDRIEGPAESPALQREILTDLADLLGDLQVYCASEMAKWGIPLEETLDIIMQSNMSKLGADGQPIYDERGKVQKGPSYWKPEPAICEMLLARGCPEA